jgi:hypothetical protein
MSDDEIETLGETQPILENITFEKSSKQKPATASAIAKKPRSQKQIEQFEKARAIRDAKRKQKIEQKILEEQQHQKELEDKILQKAISIKKKQILKQKVLDEISDEETPIEEVKKIVKPKTISQPTESKHQIKDIPISNNPRFFFI